MHMKEGIRLRRRINRTNHRAGIQRDQPVLWQDTGPKNRLLPAANIKYAYMGIAKYNKI